MSRCTMTLGTPHSNFSIYMKPFFHILLLSAFAVGLEVLSSFVCLWLLAFGQEKHLSLLSKEKHPSSIGAILISRAFSFPVLDYHAKLIWAPFLCCLRLNIFIDSLALRKLFLFFKFSYFYMFMISIMIYLYSSKWKISQHLKIT